MMCHGDFFEHLLLEREGNCEGVESEALLSLFSFPLLVSFCVLRREGFFLLPRKGILGVTVLLSASFVEYLVKK